jgi:ribosomal protein L32
MGSLSIWHWLIVFFFVMIVIWVVRRKRKSIQRLDEEAIRSGLTRCPFCAEFVRPEATICKHCGWGIQPNESL